MSMIGIAIGATGLALILIFIWMFSLSLRKKRLEEEKHQRELAYRRALEQNRQIERQERIQKAHEGHIPTILFLAKDAERKNVKEALYWYNKAAKLDDISGMYGIVRLSQTMREDLVLQEQAKYWQNYIASLEGDVTSQVDMARALFNGYGVEQDVPRAIALMRDSAQGRNVDAMLFLGEWYTSAKNPQPNPKESTYWYQCAAQQHSTEGYMRLGMNYLRGIGVPENRTAGCYWLERAAEKGHVEAMLRAGEAWLNEGGSKGNAIAYIWLFLAAHFGSESAKTLRGQVETSLGVDSVVGLQSLLRPIVRKMETGTVGASSIIKALNKLYKRDIQKPQGAPEDIYDSISEAMPLAEQPSSAALNESQPYSVAEKPTKEEVLQSNAEDTSSLTMDFSSNFKS